MSKITQEKKELKGKQKKIAESEVKKSENKATSKKISTAVSSIKNYGKCVTCTHFPHKLHGEVQPCKIAKTYVARKCSTCPKNAYKCKFEK